MTVMYSSHECYMFVGVGVWMAVLKKLSLPPSSLSSSSPQLLSILLSNMAAKPETCLRSLRSLLALQADAIVPALIEEVCRVLGDPGVVGASPEDMEVMRTPEGQLWHPAMRKE